MKQKIVIVISNNYVFDQRVQKIEKSLRDNGYDVSIVGRSLGNLPQETTLLGHVILWKLIFRKGPLFYLELNFRIFFHLLFSSYQSIYSVDVDTLGSCALVKWIRPKKMLVFDSHEIFHELPELQNHPIRKWIWKMIGTWGSQKADHRITIGQSYKDQLESQYGKPFHILRNVPDQNIETGSVIDHSNYESKLILYQGALNKDRGLDLAIRAMQDLQDFKLVLAGEGPLRFALENLVEELNLENQVTFLGNIPPEELKELTKTAFVGLNLLTNTSPSYYFSLANKFFDYLYAEIPSLNPPFPEYVEILEEYKFGLTIDQNIQDITSAIHHLKSDRAFYNAIQLHCRHSKPNFHWKNEENILIHIFNGQVTR